ncbi:beta-N-acetylglucosaminidase domain-containing protein [Streptomyces sp. NPDC088745]|uniref:beta-N-acetylglucosaminidase domain-containing protein n=1 Tax=Streptomyces sp. NPDC088745 TaxID=3365884 RepID=UPI00382E4E5C
MQLGRRRGATAVALAVMGGLLGGAPGAAAAPPAPDLPAPASRDQDGDGAPPAVWPRPQTVRAAGPAVPVGDEAVLVVAPGTDAYAVNALRSVLRGAGAHTLYEVAPGEPLPPRGLVVRAGAADEAMAALRAPATGDLPRGGYRIAVGRFGGRDTVALDGVGADGVFHAAQTLRQLVRTDGARTAVAGVVVRDWPGTAVRGMTEGFYGRPWTTEQRLAQIDFLGRTKQNRYLYAPGDDPYRQALWRDPYPAAERASFRVLAEHARRNHVTLGWAVAPGQAMCMSDDRDVRALTRKVDAMWALGVRVFQLQFQDVSYSEWHCGQDADVFGSGPAAAAKAHARVASAVARHLADRHPGAEPLSLMPTEFYQDGATEYRRALAAELDGRVQVAWTGVGVVPRTISGRELVTTREAFGHPLVTMDNYPVNDYAQDRIFLGPYTGREPAVAGRSAALLSNAMEQPSASRIPLFTAADFAWNPRGYRPQESWRAAVDDLAGDDAKAREAMRAFAGNHASSILDPHHESAYLRPLMDAFWASRSSADAGPRNAAAQRLRAAFTVMRETPRRLGAAAQGAFDDEVRPWIERFARYGQAGEQAVDMLQAQAAGDGAGAWRHSRALDASRKALSAPRVTVGKGVLDPFLSKAVRQGAAWTGADREPGQVTEGPGTYTVRLGRARPVSTVTTMAAPGVTDAAVEVHVPGEGWRRAGALTADGWTQTPVGGTRVDAVRLAWQRQAPRVQRVVPWYADEPEARLALSRAEIDAEIGGPPVRVRAALTGQRPGEVRGELVARAPRGIEVLAPKATVVPRGTDASVPLDVRVAKDAPAGEYRIPVSFGEGAEQTLVVRAAPRTAGPDLARTARISSSGDETADFPASAAADGRAGTRWSSPAGAGAWWQAELARPTRVGLVSLRWQDAYATAYRVQVSADGRTWRTAATVRDGRGGAETVRFDARDVRFVRVQGDRRATRFGYSLWSVEVYAVAEEERGRGRERGE